MFLNNLTVAFNSSNPWAPNEDSALIYAEATWLQGELLSNIAYGIELTLFTMCFWILARETNRGNYKRQLFMLTFISLIFILGTVFMGGQAKFTQDAFIEDRNFPGGPSAFEQTMFSITANEISVSAFVVGNWLMDALLVCVTYIRQLALLIAQPCVSGVEMYRYLQGRGQALGICAASSPQLDAMHVYWCVGFIGCSSPPLTYLVSTRNSPPRTDG